MRKKRTPPVSRTCSNGCDRPVKAPSKVLCAECLDVLDKKMRALFGGAL